MGECFSSKVTALVSSSLKLGPPERSVRSATMFSIGPHEGFLARGCLAPRSRCHDKHPVYCSETKNVESCEQRHEECCAMPLPETPELLQDRLPISKTWDCAVKSFSPVVRGRSMGGRG